MHFRTCSRVSIEGVRALRAVGNPAAVMSQMYRAWVLNRVDKKLPTFSPCSLRIFLDDRNFLNVMGASYMHPAHIVSTVRSLVRYLIRHIR